MTEPMPPAPDVPPAGTASTVTVTTEARTSTPFSRKVEDAGFAAAILLVTLWCLVAIAKSAGVLVGPLNQGFPWEFVILCAVLVVPKTVGRATAGRIWDKLPGRG